MIIRVSWVNINILRKYFAVLYKTLRLRCILVLILATQFQLASAEILYVPFDYRLISSALESTVDGDTILVNPGTYNEDITITNTITLVSLYLSSGDTAYVDSTIILGTGDNSVINIVGSVSPIIIGFKIMGGNVNYGGGIMTRRNASPAIGRCIITECGSGIAAIDRASPIIENCRITHNDGVGIYCREDSEPTITNTLIANNNGSGLYCRGNSNPILDNCTITQNNSQGVQLIESSPILIDCIISENVDDIVGGIYLRSGSDPELSNCTISGNTGDLFGGIVCYQSSPIFSNCIIVDNTGGSVGGIKCAVGSSPTFANTIIRGNIGIRQWGGIYIDDSQPTFSGCEISDNISGEGCAGISLNDSRSIFAKCLVYDHYSANEGGAFYITDSSPTIQKCTIVRNYSEIGGTIYFKGDGVLSINNVIMWYNASPNIYVDHGGDQNQWETTLSVSYSDIEEGIHSLLVRGEAIVSWKKGNIDTDPLFTDPENEAFQLDELSPCIDSGSPYLPLDRDGTVSDIGAFYFSQANLSVSVDTLLFEDLYSGQIDSLPVDVSNLGEQVLIIHNIQILPGLSPFTVSSPDIPHEITPHGSQRYWVRFSPRNFGAYQAILMIESNDRRLGRYIVHLEGGTLSSPDLESGIPTEFSVSKIYPNPFNSNAILQFFTPLHQIVSIELIDLKGRIYQTFYHRVFAVGSHTLVLPMGSVNTGTYFIRVKSPNNTHYQKIISIL